MEFKVENKYLTRSGLVVFLAEISDNKLDKYPLKGYILGEEEKKLSWMRNGNRYNSSREDPLDLVSETEPEALSL